MTQQILNFLAQNPLFLGLGLLVGAALWLLMAGLLSILMPATEEAEFFDEEHSWESIPPPPNPGRYAPSYEGPQALSPEASTPIWFKPSEPAAPIFSQLRTFPAPQTNLAPVVVAEKPDITPHWILKERLESLAEKLESLERTPAAPALAHFDDKVSRLSQSLSEIHHSIQSVSLFEEQKTQLEEKFDTLSRRFLGRLDEMAAFESSPGAVRHPGEESVQQEIQAALESARRERDERLRESEEGKAEILRRVEEARQSETMAVRQVEEILRIGEESILTKRQELDQAWDQLSAEKKNFETTKESEPPRISLNDLRKAQEAMQARLVALNDQQEHEHLRQEKLLARLHRRLTRWQTAWRMHITSDQTRWDAEWQVLVAQRDAALAKLDGERGQLQARLDVLRQEEAKLQNTREDFQKNVVDAWSHEKTVHELEVRHLTNQSASLESSIQEIQSRMGSEKERFDQLIQENRAAVRSKQSEWKEQLKSLQSDFQNKSGQAKDEIVNVTQSFEGEKVSLLQKESAEKEALAARSSEWQSAQAQVLQQISGEKEEWNKKIGQWRSKVQELEKMRKELDVAYASERSDQSERVDKQRAWTEQRLSTLKKLLDEVRQNAAEQLGHYAREKNIILANLRKLREEFHGRAAAAASDLESRRKALDVERREAEAEHASFLARSWDEEQKLRSEMNNLETETAALQKKLDAFRGGRERVILRLQERHEAILLRLHQEVDQVKVQGEARIAEERISLETMKARLANRQGRVAKIRQKQDEQLQVLFQELNATLELVRQGHRSESQVWINRLKSLQNQRDIWLKRRESMRTTNLVSQEMQEKEKQELARFEQEEQRLRNEREQYWKSIVEYSAANQDALRKIMEDIKGSDDQDRREALAVEILSRIREQLTHVRAFQNSLKPFDAESKISNPSR